MFYVLSCWFPEFMNPIIDIFFLEISFLENISTFSSLFWLCWVLLRGGKCHITLWEACTSETEYLLSTWQNCNGVSNLHPNVMILTFFQIISYSLYIYCTLGVHHAKCFLFNQHNNPVRETFLVSKYQSRETGGGERLSDLHMAMAMTWEICFAVRSC